MEETIVIFSTWVTPSSQLKTQKSEHMVLFFEGKTDLLW